MTTWTHGNKTSSVNMENNWLIGNFRRPVFIALNLLEYWIYYCFLHSWLIEVLIIQWVDHLILKVKRYILITKYSHLNKHPILQIKTFISYSLLYDAFYGLLNIGYFIYSPPFVNAFILSAASITCIGFPFFYCNGGNSGRFITFSLVNTVSSIGK
jgi:hypothetical protein